MKASSLGRVRSLDRTVAVSGKHKMRKYKGRLLTQAIAKRSLQHYWMVGIGHQNTILVHKLVALAFLGEPDYGNEVRHNNGDGLDNRPENLRWGTRKSNVADNFIHGKANIGSRNGQSKLTEESILEIRNMHGYQRDIAKKFGVCQQTISKAIRRETWRKSCP